MSYVTPRPAACVVAAGRIEPAVEEVPMNVGLWIGQALLAAVFLFSGLAKGLWSKERLIASGQTSVGLVPLPALRMIAFAELLAVIGLILPQLLGVAPILTPLAAFGLCIVMVGAAGVHLRLHERRNAFGNMVILAVCVFVGVGRLALAS
jgi:uncharacterized membrane protein YphA (DoxX/SURF4 family)